MIRSAALLVASTLLILTGVLNGSSKPVADGPVQQVIAELHDQINGLPHCC